MFLGCHVTHGGNADGACCHFPFIYRDIVYDRCTKSGRDNKIWCATTVDYNRDHQWGYCQGKAGSYELLFPRLDNVFMILIRAATLVTINGKQINRGCGPYQTF